MLKTHTWTLEAILSHRYWQNYIPEFSGEQIGARNVELNSSLNRLAIMHNSSRPPSAGWCCSVQGVGWQCGLHSGRGLGFFKSVTCQQPNHMRVMYIDVEFYWAWKTVFSSTQIKGWIKFHIGWIKFHIGWIILHSGSSFAWYSKLSFTPITGEENSFQTTGIVLMFIWTYRCFIFIFE